MADSSRRFDATYLPFGLPIGMIIGIAVGMLGFNSLPLGFVLGIVFGIAIGVVMGLRNHSDEEDELAEDQAGREAHLRRAEEQDRLRHRTRGDQDDRDSQGPDQR